MKEKKLKIFTLPIEEFEKKYPVSYSIVVPGIPEGHVAKVVSVRPCGGCKLNCVKACS